MKWPAPSRIVLACALLLLCVLYALWFRDDRHLAAAWLVFALPPLLLSIGVATGRPHAPFWAGVFALGWFAHAVMVAWSRPPEAACAWAAIALSLGIILATSWPALHARRRKKE